MKPIPVINIRGTNGSGKSFLLRRWMVYNNARPQPQRNNLLGGSSLSAPAEWYQLEDGGIVIGCYDQDCGGCDRIKTTEAVREAIQSARARKPKYVIFEGVIISTVFESWHEFSKKIGGMLWVYLDTPLAVCLERIQQRNRGAKINENLVHNKIKSIESTRRKAVAAGERVVALHWENAFVEFQQLMRQL